jgi:ACT domain-containing protein
MKSSRIVVTVIGQDKVGIIANISQTTMREFFAMIMMVELEKATLPFDEIKRRLNALGERMGLRIDAQHEDVFKYMHRI